MLVVKETLKKQVLIKKRKDNYPSYITRINGVLLVQFMQELLKLDKLKIKELDM